MIWLSFNGLFILSLVCSFFHLLQIPSSGSLVTSFMQIKTWRNNEWKRQDMRRVKLHLNSTKQDKCKRNFNSFDFHLYHHVSCLVLHLLCFHDIFILRWMQLLHNCRFCLFTDVLCVSSSLKGRNVNMFGAWEHNTTYSLISWLIQWLYPRKQQHMTWCVKTNKLPLVTLDAIIGVEWIFVPLVSHLTLGRIIVTEFSLLLLNSMKPKKNTFLFSTCVLPTDSCDAFDKNCVNTQMLLWNMEWLRAL